MLRCASYLVTAAYPKYASFLSIRVPCLRPFYELINYRFLRLFQILLRRKELLTTETELKAIAAAAYSGLSRIPEKGYSTPAAMGMPTTL